MNVRRGFGLGIAALLLLAGVAIGKEAREARGPVAGDEAAQHVTQLRDEISWQRSLGDAEARAKREGKLILWVHVLGDLDGAT